MKRAYLTFILFITTLISFSLPVLAEIKPPNYDFTFDSLKPYLPGENFTKIKPDKTIQSDIFENNGNLVVFRIKLKRANYNIDVYVQTKNDIIVDMYARLPQHFIHDIFLADLQKKYKKQDKYVQKDMSALYVWMNREGNNIIYHGSCSITCFPMFIEVVSSDKSVVPFYQKFNLAIPKF